jgi:hypothetical protein
MSNNIAENIIIPIKSDEESAESFVGVWKIAPTLKYYNDNFNSNINNGRNTNMNGILTTWMIDVIEKVLDNLNLNIKLYVGILNCIVSQVVYNAGGNYHEHQYAPNTFYTNTNLIIRVLKDSSGFNYILTTKTEDYNVCIRYDHHPHCNNYYSENVEQKNYTISLNDFLNTPRRLTQFREMISRHLVFEINPKIYLDYMLMCDDNERIHRFIHKTDDVNKIKEMETKLLETETKLRETEQKLNEFEKTIKMKMSEHMENVDNILDQVNNIQQSLKNKNNNATIVINVKSFGHSSRILLQRICLSSINCFKWITILGKFMERFSHFSKT